mmetsp:Transcript_48410/g.128110  ORF Transcript_48410/g.128110 Transcript_48410/m.128110 type:complete len:150 (+) Transcript_48410:19-468(+)
MRLGGPAGSAAAAQQVLAAAAQNSVTGSLEGDTLVTSKAQRAAIMQKLWARSKVICLRNMVEVDEVDSQLEEEISGECSKYGKVDKVVIATMDDPLHKGKKQVKIFVSFLDEHQAAAAVTALDKRWFAGKSVQASFYDQDRFNHNDFSG